jgi:hypothetical protein
VLFLGTKRKRIDTTSLTRTGFWPEYFRRHAFERGTIVAKINDGLMDLAKITYHIARPNEYGYTDDHHNTIIITEVSGVDNINKCYILSEFASRLGPVSSYLRNQDIDIIYMPIVDITSLQLLMYCSAIGNSQIRMTRPIGFEIILISDIPTTQTFLIDLVDKRSKKAWEIPRIILTMNFWIEENQIMQANGISEMVGKKWEFCRESNPDVRVFWLTELESGEGEGRYFFNYDKELVDLETWTIEFFSVVAIIIRKFSEGSTTYQKLEHEKNQELHSLLLFTAISAVKYHLFSRIESPSWNHQRGLFIDFNAPDTGYVEFFRDPIDPENNNIITSDVESD